MKNVFKIFVLLGCAALIFAACTKEKALPYYGSGTAPTLSSDVNSFAPTPADSDNVALTFAWSNPGYATDSSTIKYIVQVDSSGKNFSNPYSTTVNGALGVSFIAKDFNNILLGMGFQFGVQYSVDVRVISSY